MRAELSKLFNSDPGGRPPIRSDITLGVGAAVSYARSRDIPDVLGLADLSGACDETFEVVRWRINHDCVLRDHGMFPLPKADGKSVRSITLLNPFDEAVARSFVGRSSAAIEWATDPEVVLNGRITRAGRADWYPTDYIGQHIKRRGLQRGFYDDPRTVGVAFFDVKDFFKECLHETCGSLLIAAGAPLGAARVLIDMFGRIYPGGRGLPVGFDGSGPIANLFLAELDRRLTANGFRFVRWTDDLDVFLSHASQWPVLYELVTETLADVGLRLNETKTDYVPKGPEAEQQLLDPGRDSIFAGIDVASEEGAEAIEAALDDLACGDDLNPGRLRSVFGALRKNHDPSGLAALVEHPDWLYREPRNIGNYLLSFAQDKNLRKQIDLDWMMGLALHSDPTSFSKAGQVHVLRVMSEYRMDQQRGARLQEFAWSCATDPGTVTLGAFAARAWARSKAWRARDAAHLAGFVQDLGYRRAALSGFASIPAHEAEKWVGPIAQRHPEIRPLVRVVTDPALQGSLA